MLVLGIETCCGPCSVAVYSLSFDRDKIIFKKLSGRKEQILNMQTERLSRLVIDCLKEIGIEIEQIQAILVTNGPGSFTGCRIGLSYAYGLKIGLENKGSESEIIPIIPINTLDCLAATRILREENLKDNNLRNFDLTDQEKSQDDRLDRRCTENDKNDVPLEIENKKKVISILPAGVDVEGFGLYCCSIYHTTLPQKSLDNIGLTANSEKTNQTKEYEEVYDQFIINSPIILEQEYKIKNFPQIQDIIGAYDKKYHYYTIINRSAGKDHTDKNLANLITLDNAAIVVGNCQELGISQTPDVDDLAAALLTLKHYENDLKVLYKKFKSYISLKQQTKFSLQEVINTTWTRILKTFPIDLNISINPQEKIEKEGFPTPFYMRDPRIG